VQHCSAIRQRTISRCISAWHSIFPLLASRCHCSYFLLVKYISLSLTTIRAVSMELHHRPATSCYGSPSHHSCASKAIQHSTSHLSISYSSVQYTPMTDHAMYYHTTYIHDLLQSRMQPQRRSIASRTHSAPPKPHSHQNYPSPHSLPSNVRKSILRQPPK
jgi:hypothetical protein